MKAVVLSKQNNECIVLADDESMHTVPATITVGSELNVGDVFELAPFVKPERPGRKRMYRIIAAAAVFCIALLGTFYYTTFTVSATVTTEGEAPITYYLNHWGKVLRAEPQNEAAEAVLEDMGDLGTRPDLDDVLELTAASMQRQGLLGEEEELAYAVDKGNDGKVDERGTVPPPKEPDATGPTYTPGPSNNKDDSDKETKNKKPSGKKPTKPTKPSTDPTPAPTDPTPAPTDPTPAPTDPTPAPTDPPDDPGGDDADDSGGGNDNGGGNNGGGSNGGGSKRPSDSGSNQKPQKPPAGDSHPDKPGKTEE